MCLIYIILVYKCIITIDDRTYAFHLISVELTFLVDKDSKLQKLIPLEFTQLKCISISFSTQFKTIKYIFTDYFILDRDLGNRITTIFNDNIFLCLQPYFAAVRAQRSYLQTVFAKKAHCLVTEYAYMWERDKDYNVRRCLNRFSEFPLSVVSIFQPYMFFLVCFFPLKFILEEIARK